MKRKTLLLAGSFVILAGLGLQGCSATSKSKTDGNAKLALVSSGDSSPTLGAFDFSSDNSKWYFKDH
ncbi:MAG: hypothetical protein ACTHMD_20025 [Flavisolibacter sp.]